MTPRTPGGPSPADHLAAFYREGFPARLGVAVSGGSDSLALLHLLHDRIRTGLAAVTVDHRLRPESASEALHVARLCERLGVPHDVLQRTGWDGRGNLQDQARRSRTSLIADWARSCGIEAVALGHTADDQAETVLMRLARAAGVDGLSGMAPRHAQEGIEWHRPLLTCGREALREVLQGTPSCAGSRTRRTMTLPSTGSRRGARWRCWRRSASTRRRWGR